MFDPRYRQQFVWLAVVYAAVIGLVLYPGLHEGFAGTVIFWNCVPPTLGFVLIMMALGKSRRRVIVSAVFGLIAAVVALFFFAAWFFTPLDTDPHSSSTTLVFVYAPVFSAALATIGSAVAWFAIRVT
jgi:hypothetical protein